MPPPQENRRRYFIQTFGCQMNKNDSEKMAALLEQAGYKVSSDWQAADLVVINTCSVRSHAEDRAFGHLGRLKNLEKSKPGLRIVVAGCLPQRDARFVLRKAPFVDLVIGTHNLHRLPELLSQRSDLPVVEIWPERTACSPALPAARSPSTLPVTRNPSTPAWVSIIYGCNNFCSYCVVPYVRGQEHSRQPEEIFQEIAAIDPNTHPQITLLGQNVNSYLWENFDFADLLTQAAQKFPQFRFEFLTSHPKDTTEKVIAAVAGLPNVAKSFHLPLQSGDDKILELMNRKYTVEQYKALIEKIRRAIPRARISTDIIVGFPGEGEAEFANTHSVLEEIKFQRVNVAAFDPRPGTSAASLPEQVSAAIKQERLQKALALVRKPNPN